MARARRLRLYRIDKPQSLRVALLIVAYCMFKRQNFRSAQMLARLCIF